MLSDGPPAGDMSLVRRGRGRFGTLLADGTQMDLDDLRSGDWFGEIAMLDGMPRPRDARAVRETVLGHGARPVVDRLMGEQQLAWALVVLLARRLVAIAFELLGDLRCLPTDELVLKRLRPLAGSDGVVTTNHETLASVLRVSRVTVGNLLRRLAAVGRLTIGYRRIHLIAGSTG